jgi:hypothetical protein
MDVLACEIAALQTWEDKVCSTAWRKYDTDKARVSRFKTGKQADAARMRERRGRQPVREDRPPGVVWLQSPLRTSKGVDEDESVYAWDVTKTVERWDQIRLDEWVEEWAGLE